MFARPRSTLAGRDGFSLLLVLMFVALLVAIIVTFVARSTLQSSVIDSSSRRQEVDLLTDYASDWAVDSLISEILAGSIILGDPAGADKAPNLYRPREASALQVFRNSGTFIPTLVKRSAANTPFFSGTAYTLPTTMPAEAGDVSSKTRSRNGRLLDEETWSRPGFAEASAYSGGNLVPNWIVLTKTGAFSGTGDITKFRDEKNDEFAIGRMAYAIYDISGLLDINIAGNLQPASYNSAGGGLSHADLTAIPGIGDADTLLQWRSPQTASDTTWLESASNLGLKAIRGEERFLNRQDLLNYGEANPGVIGAAALPFLTTFSRELNAPSWFPDFNGSNPAFTNLQYRNQAVAARSSLQTDILNPDVLSVRRKNSGTWTTPEGEEVSVAAGDPLVRRRFSLKHLDLFRQYEADPSSATVRAAIEYYFGLRPSASDLHTWDYINGVANGSEISIRSLGEVAQLGTPRDPDFFEILQSAILRGSLAPKTVESGAVAPGDYDGSRYGNSHSVLRIGAALIDQYDADSLPTAINTINSTNLLNREKTRVYGFENLPYLSEFIPYVYRPTADPDRKTVKSLWSAELWNPHRNAGDVATETLRLVWASGRTRLRLNNTANFGTTAFVQTGLDSAPLDIAASDDAKPTLSLQNSASFQEPTLLSASLASSSDPLGSFAEGAVQRFGFSIGEDIMNVQYSGTTPTTQPFYNHAQFEDRSLHPRFKLQVRDGAGDWRTYQFVTVKLIGGYFKFTGTQAPATYGTSTNSFQAANYFSDTSYGLADPRDPLIGGSYMNSSVAQSVWPAADIASPGFLATATYFATALTTPTSATVTTSWTSQIYPGFFSRNLPTGSVSNPYSPYYKDADYFQRPADGAYGLFPVADTRSVAVDSVMPARTVILNRPFRSVGELSETYRGLLWRTLDFSSVNSADSALLDFFSLEDGGMSGGRVNVNSAPAPVLEALINRIGLQPRAAGSAAPTLVTTAEAATLATAVRSQLATNPITNRSQLANTLIADSSVVGSLPTAARKAKTSRELLARSLADASNVRTWNLMVDLVVQSGRYPPGASSAADFVVHGQKRVWLHLAIDRFTGELIDQRIEEVHE